LLTWACRETLRSSCLRSQSELLEVCSASTTWLRTNDFSTLLWADLHFLVYRQWLNWGGGSQGISTPSPLIWDPPPLTTDPPPLILDPPHFTQRSLGYSACLNAPFDLFQLFNHRAPHTKLWTKTDFSSARWDGMLYACSKLFPESDKRIV